MKKLLISVAALALAATSANAAVLNGGFETNGGNGQIGVNTTLANWTIGGPPSYWFVFTPGAAPTSPNQFGNNTTLYGPVPASPNGGFFVGADPGFQNATLSQTLTGLTPGSLYTITFNWAGGQQVGYDGATNEGWKVTFGNQTQSTNPLISNPNHGFTGWNTTSFNFIADGTSDTLTFLALGTPTQGAPPFALLDGVSISQGVPEPATWAMLMVGFGAMGVMLRRRRRELAVTATA